MRNYHDNVSCTCCDAGDWAGEVDENGLCVSCWLEIRGVYDNIRERGNENLDYEWVATIAQLNLKRITGYTLTTNDIHCINKYKKLEE